MENKKQCRNNEAKERECGPHSLFFFPLFLRRFCAWYFRSFLSFLISGMASAPAACQCISWIRNFTSWHQVRLGFFLHQIYLPHLFLILSFSLFIKTSAGSPCTCMFSVLCFAQLYFITWHRNATETEVGNGKPRQIRTRRSFDEVVNDCLHAGDSEKLLYFP